MTNNQVQGSRAKPNIAEAATQADREAAADLMLTIYGDRMFGDRDRREDIRNGQNDKFFIVQAFARHRQSSANELLAVLERVNSELAHHGRVEVGTDLACRVSEVITLAKTGA